MFEKPPRCRFPNRQAMTDAGFHDAKAGKPLAELENKGYGPWDPGARAAWLYGWECGGGDIKRRIVVTEEQRLVERRQDLLAEMERIDARLSVLRPTQETSPAPPIGTVGGDSSPSKTCPKCGEELIDGHHKPDDIPELF